MTLWQWWWWWWWWWGQRQNWQWWHGCKNVVKLFTKALSLWLARTSLLTFKIISCCSYEGMQRMFKQWIWTGLVVWLGKFKGPITELNQSDCSINNIFKKRAKRQLERKGNITWSTKFAHDYTERICRLVFFCSDHATLGLYYQDLGLIFPSTVEPR